MKKSIDFWTLVLFCSLLLLNACKKHENSDPVNTTNVQKVPFDTLLLGTWQSGREHATYYEFMPDSLYSYYKLIQSSYKIKLLQAFSIEAHSINLSAPSGNYVTYEVRNDSVLFYDKNGAVYNFWIRFDNRLINHQNWLKPVKVLATFDLPYGFITDRNTDYCVNFGINGDTLYYYHNFRRIMKYNPYKNEYYDSMGVYTATGLFYDAPFLIYTMDTIYQNNTFNNFNVKYKTRPFGAIAAACIGKDQSTDDYYLWQFHFAKSTLYKAKKGETPVEVKNFKPLESTPSALYYYKENRFLELDDGQLNLFEFDGNNTRFMETYDLPTGFNYYSYLSTNGTDTWIVSGNFLTNQYKLMKIDLDQ